MNKDKMLENLRKIFQWESLFYSDFANIQAKLAITDFETLYHELDGNNRQDTPNFATFNFQYYTISGTITRTPEGRAHLDDKVCFCKPSHTDASLIIYLDSEGYPANLSYCSDQIHYTN